MCLKLAFQGQASHTLLVWAQWVTNISVPVFSSEIEVTVHVPHRWAIKLNNPKRVCMDISLASSPYI